MGRFARAAHHKRGWEERTLFLAVPGGVENLGKKGKKIAKFREVESDHSFVPL